MPTISSPGAMPARCGAGAGDHVAYPELAGGVGVEDHAVVRARQVHVDDRQPGQGEGDDADQRELGDRSAGLHRRRSALAGSYANRRNRLGGRCERPVITFILTGTLRESSTVAPHNPPRIFRRVPFETAVRLRFDNFSGFVTEYSGNISLGGMFIRSDSPPPIGTQVEIEFKLDDDFDLIRGRGKVIWVRDEAAAPASGAGPGSALRRADPGQSRADLPGGRPLRPPGGHPLRPRRGGGAGRRSGGGRSRAGAGSGRWPIPAPPRRRRPPRSRRRARSRRRRPGQGACRRAGAGAGGAGRDPAPRPGSSRLAPLDLGRRRSTRWTVPPARLAGSEAARVGRAARRPPPPRGALSGGGRSTGAGIRRRPRAGPRHRIRRRTGGPRCWRRRSSWWWRRQPGSMPSATGSPTGWPGGERTPSRWPPAAGSPAAAPAPGAASASSASLAVAAGEATPPPPSPETGSAATAIPADAADAADAADPARAAGAAEDPAHASDAAADRSGQPGRVAATPATPHPQDHLEPARRRHRPRPLGRRGGGPGGGPPRPHRRAAPARGAADHRHRRALLAPADLAVGSAQLRRVRSGVHREMTPPELHVVLDLAGSRVAITSLDAGGAQVRVRLEGR